MNNQLGHLLMSVGGGPKQYCSVSAKRNCEVKGYAHERSSGRQIQSAAPQIRRQPLILISFQTAQEELQQSARQHVLLDGVRLENRKTRPIQTDVEVIVAIKIVRSLEHSSRGGFAAAHTGEYGAAADINFQSIKGQL